MARLMMSQVLYGLFLKKKKKLPNVSYIDKFQPPQKFIPDST